MRWLGKLERFLGSSTLLILCYAVVSRKFIEAAGFHFQEWLLCLLIFINLSTKLEQIHAIATGSREGHDSEAWRGAKQARAGRRHRPNSVEGNTE